jgi:DNA processing protein
MYVERIKLNLDSIAMMLFCARLKAYKEVPLSNEEWLLIERIIKKKGLKGPASLLSLDIFYNQNSFYSPINSNIDI